MNSGSEERLDSMRRPTLSDKVTRGMEHLLPVMRVMLEAPSENDFESCTDEEIDEAIIAVRYIQGLIDWKRSQKSKEA